MIFFFYGKYFVCHFFEFIVCFFIGNVWILVNLQKAVPVICFQRNIGIGFEILNQLF